MATEDGVVLATLLGHLSRTRATRESPAVPSIASVLKLFESLRKKRTTTNVQGASENRVLFHMRDGPYQVARDEALAQVDWDHGPVKCPWKWADLDYQKAMLSFDCVADTHAAFEQWLQTR